MSQPTPPDAESPRAEASRADPPAPREARAIERAMLRLGLWQTVLSVAGAIIAVIALYAALTESAAVRQQTAAAVWPYVQFTVEDFDTGDEAGVTLAFSNKGVGPAKLRTATVRIDGVAVRDWDEAIARLGGDPAAKASRNFIRHRVLVPGGRFDAFATRDPALARAFQAAIAREGTSIAYCYCSIFDACWLADSRDGAWEPRAVDRCPEDGPDAFRH